MRVPLAEMQMTRSPASIVSSLLQLARTNANIKANKALMPADRGGGNLSDIHRVTLFLRSTFYHLFPQRYNNILKQARKSGESFEKKYSGGFMASGVLSRK